LKLEIDKYCETKLIFKIDIYFETEGVILIRFQKEIQKSWYRLQWMLY